MKVRVLIENTTNSILVAEHGLSFLIEYNNKKYLLDAGATGSFIQNAKNMNLDLADVECAILSHGHYDHAGGFEKYFDEYVGANLYAMKSAIEKYYSGSGGIIHEIGVPQPILDKHSERFILIEGITKLEKDIYLVPHNTDGLEKIGEKSKLYKMINEELISDNFAHELSLVFDTPQGLMIFNSCSHGGIVNIVNEVMKALPNKKVHSFFGGLHMQGKKDGEIICTFSENEIKEIADYLNKIGLQKLYTGHCTGEPAIKLLEKYLGDNVERLVTGKTICI